MSDSAFKLDSRRYTGTLHLYLYFTSLIQHKVSNVKGFIILVNVCLQTFQLFDTLNCLNCTYIKPRTADSVQKQMIHDV